MQRSYGIERHCASGLSALHYSKYLALLLQARPGTLYEFHKWFWMEWALKARSTSQQLAICFARADACKNTGSSQLFYTVIPGILKFSWTLLGSI